MLICLATPSLTVIIRGIVRLGVDFADLVDVVRPGSVLHLRDGAIGIRIDKVTRSCAEGVVLNSGSIGERKVVQIDGISMHNTLSSESRDMKDITEFAVEHSVDFVAIGKVCLRAAGVRGGACLQSPAAMPSSCPGIQLTIANIRLQDEGSLCHVQA